MFATVSLMTWAQPVPIRLQCKPKRRKGHFCTTGLKQGNSICCNGRHQPTCSCHCECLRPAASASFNFLQTFYHKYGRAKPIWLNEVGHLCSGIQDCNSCVKGTSVQDQLRFPLSCCCLISAVTCWSCCLYLLIAGDFSTFLPPYLQPPLPLQIQTAELNSSH